MKKNRWKVISYYTPDYTEVAERLEQSLQRLHLPYELFPLPDTHNWYLNTELKAYVVQAMLETQPYDVVFLDADAEVLYYPELFDTIDCDIAAHIYRGVEFLSGTLFFKNNDIGRKIAREWILLNNAARTEPRDLEQRRLGLVIEDMKPKFFNLPQEYCYIFDTPFTCAHPCIVHYQHSRKTRRKGLR